MPVAGKKYKLSVIKVHHDEDRVEHIITLGEDGDIDCGEIQLTGDDYLRLRSISGYMCKYLNVKNRSDVTSQHDLIRDANPSGTKLVLGWIYADRLKSGAFKRVVFPFSDDGGIAKKFAGKGLFARINLATLRDIAGAKLQIGPEAANAVGFSGETGSLVAAWYRRRGVAVPKPGAAPITVDVDEIIRKIAGHASRGRV